MKKMILIVAVTAIMLPVCCIAQDIKYNIRGKIGKLTAPAKAYLFIGDQLDSAVFNKGLFHFTGVVKEPKAAYLLVNKNGTGGHAGQLTGTPYQLRFYIEPGIITIKSPDSINNATVTAGTLNADYFRLSASLKPAESALSKLLDQIRSATPEMMQSDSFGKDTERQLVAIGEMQKRTFLKFMEDNPDALMSLQILKCYGGFDYSILRNNNQGTPGVEELDSLFNSLSLVVRSGRQGVQFASLIARLKGPQIGFMAAGFVQPDTSGNLIALSDFKGKYVLIDFWASWCKPCRAENPAVVSAYRAYQPNGFTVLSVSLDGHDGKNAWLKAIHEDQLTWTHVSDLKGWKNEAAELYGVTAIPQNYLINPNGKIVAKNLRGAELEKILKSLITQ